MVSMPGTMYSVTAAPARKTGRPIGAPRGEPEGSPRAEDGGFSVALRYEPDGPVGQGRRGGAARRAFVLVPPSGDVGDGEHVVVPLPVALLRADEVGTGPVAPACQPPEVQHGRPVPRPETKATPAIVPPAVGARIAPRTLAEGGEDGRVREQCEGRALGGPALRGVAFAQARLPGGIAVRRAPAAGDGAVALPEAYRVRRAHRDTALRLALGRPRLLGHRAAVPGVEEAQRESLRQRLTGEAGVQAVQGVAALVEVPECLLASGAAGGLLVRVEGAPVVRLSLGAGAGPPGGNGCAARASPKAVTSASRAGSCDALRFLPRTARPFLPPRP